MLAAVSLLGEVHGPVLLLVDDALCLPLVEDIGGPVVVDELELSSVQAGLQLGYLLSLLVLTLLPKSLCSLGLLDLGLASAPLAGGLQEVGSCAFGNYKEEKGQNI